MHISGGTKYSRAGRQDDERVQGGFSARKSPARCETWRDGQSSGPQAGSTFLSVGTRTAEMGLMVGGRARRRRRHQIGCGAIGA